jgi:hypothetical protein
LLLGGALYCGGGYCRVEKEGLRLCAGASFSI